MNQRARGLQGFESLPPFCELYHEQGSGNWDVAAATPRGCSRLQGAAAALKGRVCESWAAEFTDATGNAAYAVRSYVMYIAFSFRCEDAILPGVLAQDCSI